MIVEQQETLQSKSAAARPAQVPRLLTARYEVRWANTVSDVEQAQRLRYKVFAEEMGAQLRSPVLGLDQDEYDHFCKHLMLIDTKTEKVVGTYRVLLPEAAAVIGHWYSDGEFDLQKLHNIRRKTLELGRSCVHRDHRNGTAMLYMWRALAELMAHTRLQYMIGCVSIGLKDNGAEAAGLWQWINDSRVFDTRFAVTPHTHFPVEKIGVDKRIPSSSLLQAYAHLGAKVLAQPAWDADFNTADFLMLLHYQDLPERFKRLFNRVN